MKLIVNRIMLAFISVVSVFSSALGENNECIWSVKNDSR